MTSHDEADDPSYIDYEAFLNPNFRASVFANSLVLATNDPNDAPLDLSTPLSRVLFDIQEIDSHLDLLSVRSALPLLQYTQEQTGASTRIVGEIGTQIKALTDSYQQLEKEVIHKHADAEEVRQVASRLWETMSLGRALGRCLQLGRQLEVQHAEYNVLPTSGISITNPSGRKEDHGALVRCAQTLLSLRDLFATGLVPGGEGFGLDRVQAVASLRQSVIDPIERSVRESAEKMIEKFALGPDTSFAQFEESRARIVSALTTLYLLSPLPPTSSKTTAAFTPTTLLRALEEYLRTAQRSSAAGLSRALTGFTLPSFKNALSDVSARCQNVAALEVLLRSTKTPPHPLLPLPQQKLTSSSITSSSSAAELVPTSAPTPTPKTTTTASNLLLPLFAHLETGSLPSWYWRTLASLIAPRAAELVSRGGAAARTLRLNRNTVSDMVRDCVIAGSHLPTSCGDTHSSSSSSSRSSSSSSSRKGPMQWEREVAVMVGSVMGALGR